MKRKLLAVGLLLALSALTVGRLITPASGEARMTLYQRHPWPTARRRLDKRPRVTKA